MFLIRFFESMIVVGLNRVVKVFYGSVIQVN